MSFLDNPAIIAGTATLVGGAGLKIVESWLSRQSRKNTDAMQLREELRTQVDGLKAEVIAMREAEDKIEQELEQWRSRYYDLRDQYVAKQTELTMALAKIKEYQERAEKNDL